MNKISRRNFARLAAALSVAPYLGTATAEAHPLFQPLTSKPEEWPGYEKAIVIDFLASPGPFNTAERVTGLTPEMVKNAVDSGITAINLTIGGRTGPGIEDFFRTMAIWEREMKMHPNALMQIQNMADLAEAKRTKRLGIIYGFQDCTIMGDDLSRVEMFSSFGVRIMQLTYNVRNQFADGCLVPDDQGLNPFGHELVAELNKQKVIVDLSHCSTKTTNDGIKASKAPVAISHSGCKAVADLPRSKRDEELKMMADKGGVIGIYLMPFLVKGRAPSDEDVMMHIEHALKVCGEDHVGIGSDLSITPHNVTEEYKKSHAVFVKGRKEKGIAAPGEDENIFMFVPELNKANRMELIADNLLKRGHKASVVEKIVGGNFARLMKEVW
ncbi:MAG: membrane dipeptidase [Cyclobacteriaceae bacterium]